jgi:hypothetical protein
LDEDIKAAASVAFVLGEYAGELRKRTSARVAQGNEGFFFTLGEIGQGKDGFFLNEGAEVSVALPLGGVDESGVESRKGFLALLQSTLDSNG